MNTIHDDQVQISKYLITLTSRPFCKYMLIDEHLVVGTTIMKKLTGEIETTLLLRVGQ